MRIKFSIITTSYWAKRISVCSENNLPENLLVQSRSKIPRHFHEYLTFRFLVGGCWLCSFFSDRGDTCSNAGGVVSKRVDSPFEILSPTSLISQKMVVRSPLDRCDSLLALQHSPIQTVTVRDASLSPEKTQVLPQLFLHSPSWHLAGPRLHLPHL